MNNVNELKEKLERLQFEEYCSWYDYLLSKIQQFDLEQEEFETTINRLVVGYLANEILEIRNADIALGDNDSIKYFVHEKLSKTLHYIDFAIHQTNHKKTIELLKKLRSNIEVAIRYTKG